MNQSYDKLTQATDTSAPLCTPLSSYRIIEVSGADTEKFLQGQLSCDIRKLAEQGHLPGSHCNIKGHMISLFRLLYLGPQKIWLRVHQSIAQSAFDNLKKYSIFSKVSLRFADELSGVAIDAATHQQLTPLLSENDSVLATYDANLHELWTSDDRLLAQLSANEIKGTPEAQWILANIERALPDLRAETQEHFIPQMTNLQAVEGVSFSKGCYTGQEIVTRLQHRGILKKAMYRFATSSTDEVEAGAAVLNREAQAVGEVVLAASSASGTHLLAVVQQAEIDKQTPLSLESGSALEFQGLPYTLDPQLFEKKR